MAATVLARRAGRVVDAGRLGVASVVPLGLALAAALPGPAVAPRVVFAAAGMAAWALLLVVATNTKLAALTAVVAVAVPVGVTTAGRVIWHWPYLTMGCVLLAVSLLLAIQAPLMSPVFAKFPFFYVPAPGEESPPPLPLAQIQELPQRAMASQAYQAGLIAASVILAAVGSVLVLWLPDSPSLVAWWLVVVVGVVTLLRLRLFDAAAPALWFLASPLLTTAALAVSFAAAGHLVAAVWAGAALVGFGGLLVAAAVLKPRGMSIPRRGWLDAAESVLLWTIVPAMIWLFGVVSLIRNRGPL
jgi:type VII secretion integral membrane protein EccD